MRCLSELYGALILLALGVGLAATIYTAVNAAVQIEHENPKPILLVRINDTHAICYVAKPLNLTYWHSVGTFTCWIIPPLTSSSLEPCGSTLPADTYILVSPPWLCD